MRRSGCSAPSTACWQTRTLSSRRAASSAIPSDLAYGENGAGDAIPPNSQLQFDCKLKSVEKGAGAIIATFPGGLPNVILVTLLALSFVPYFLPPEMQPSQWQAGGGM